MKDKTVETIRATIETAGIELIPENGGGPGVRLRKAGKRADDYPKPAGPATDAFDKMHADIEAHRASRKRKP